MSSFSIKMDLTAVGTARQPTEESLPRLGPGSARSLLLTLLGEFAIHSLQPVWTSTIISVLEGVGVGEKSARQALMRTAAAGWIGHERNGRRTAWRLTDNGRRFIQAGSDRLKSLQRTEWDGNWLILHLPLPDTDKSNRVKTYRALSWLGFGNPSTALWINPHTDRQRETSALLASLKVDRSANAFIGRPLEPGASDLELAERAWDLQAVLAHYQALRSTFASMNPKRPDDVLFAHVQLVNQLQRLPFIDPGLPRALQPAGWHTADIAAALAENRRSWHDTAHARWNELAGQPASR